MRRASIVANALAVYRSVLPLHERELDAAVDAVAVSALGRLNRIWAEDVA